MDVKLNFGQTLVLRKCLEKKQLEIFISKQKLRRETIVFMEQIAYGT